MNDGDDRFLECAVELMGGKEIELIGRQILRNSAVNDCSEIRWLKGNWELKGGTFSISADKNNPTDRADALMM